MMNEEKNENLENENILTAMELADGICSVLFDKRAEDIVILDLHGVSDMTDLFVVASAVSPMHLKALVEELRRILRDNGVRPAHVEGTKNSKWVLLDFVDVIVHLFLPQSREYYALEEYWGDAVKIEYKGEEDND